MGHFHLYDSIHMAGSEISFPKCFVVLCAEPNDESAANVDAAKTWRDDRAKFNEIAQRTVRKSLGL